MFSVLARCGAFRGAGVSTSTSSEWSIGPAGQRYAVLGEEGDELVMIVGHGFADDDVDAVIRHAGFDDDGGGDLNRSETWGRERRDCPRHRWLPRWFRHLLITWARNSRRLPPLVGRIEGCFNCVHVDHHRFCGGCGWCAGTGEVPA